MKEFLEFVAAVILVLILCGFVALALLKVLFKTGFMTDGRRR